MDKITIDRINAGAHPKLRRALLAEYKEANNLLGKGVRLRFTYVLRTFAEQTKLFNQKPKVTNAKAGQSYHNYGLAFDIVLMYDKNLDGHFEEVSWDMIRDGDNDKISDWLEVTLFFIKKGYTNGFISKGKKWDFSHFQKTFGYHWKQLLAKHNAKDFIAGTNFVKI